MYFKNKSAENQIKVIEKTPKNSRWLNNKYNKPIEIVIIFFFTK